MSTTPFRASTIADVRYCVGHRGRTRGGRTSPRSRTSVSDRLVPNFNFFLFSFRYIYGSLPLISFAPLVLTSFSISYLSLCGLKMSHDVDDDPSQTTSCGTRHSWRSISWCNNTCTNKFSRRSFAPSIIEVQSHGTTSVPTNGCSTTTSLRSRGLGNRSFGGVLECTDRYFCVSCRRWSLGTSISGSERMQVVDLVTRRYRSAPLQSDSWRDRHVRRIPSHIGETSVHHPHIPSNPFHSSNPHIICRGISV